MMILIRNGEVFGPCAMGRCDILTGGGKILSIQKSISPGMLADEVEVVDAQGLAVVPGFVDGHQHFTGGGGEGGFHTRTPEMQLSMNTANGVTTAVGLLGWHPSPTITGSVARDLVYIQPVIGCKLALSDIRGPHMEAVDLATLAAEIRVAALVANKPGFITVHTGIKPAGLDLIFEVVNQHAGRPDMFIPTHINRRNPALTEQVLELARLGATVFSSDAGGSLPVWNEDRSRIVSMGIGTPASLRFELTSLVNTRGMPLEKALRPLTITPARVYGLAGVKGELKAGADADILVLDPATMAVRDVLARGTVMLRNRVIARKGYFE